MTTMKLFCLLALLAISAQAARMPDLQLVEEDLPESVVAFQGADSLQAHKEESLEGLDLGE